MLKNTSSSQSMIQEEKKKGGRGGGRRNKCGEKTELHTTWRGFFILINTAYVSYRNSSLNSE